MTPGQALVLAVDVVKQYLDTVPDETVRDGTRVALDLLGTGAEANKDTAQTSEEFRQQLEQAMPRKWEAMIREKFNRDTDPAQPVAGEVPPDDK